MRYWIILISLALLACEPSSDETAKTATYEETIQAHRQKTDSLFREPGASPLPSMEVIAGFSGLSYFPIDSTYRLRVPWKRVRDATPFVMPTTGDHENQYVLFGSAFITLSGRQDTLHIYQNLDLVEEGRLEESLFIPFRDATTGQSTYGGGRYLDVPIPDSDTMEIDFNLAYNPYCVYNYSYSCPIPPPENTLSMAVKAGEKMIEIPQP